MGFFVPGGMNGPRWKPMMRSRSDESLSVSCKEKAAVATNVKIPTTDPLPDVCAGGVDNGRLNGRPASVQYEVTESYLYKAVFAAC